MNAIPLELLKPVHGVVPLSEGLQFSVHIIRKDRRSCRMHVRLWQQRVHIGQGLALVYVKYAGRNTAGSNAIGQLAAGIAHEINTPIQYVGDNIHFLSDSFKGLSALLAAYRELECPDPTNATALPSLRDRTARLAEEIDVEYLQAEIPKAIQQSLEGVKRVAEIVGAMKELSHPGTTAKRAVDLNHLISNTILVSKHAWKLVAEVTTAFDSELPSIQCIAGDLSQVILNLIVNASDAIADAIKDKGGIKGLVGISTRRCGDWAEIRVSDSGTGIPESIQPRIFDPFFTTKDVGKGTGQGLAIAHAIVTQKHQGTIQLETQKGVGTTFVIRLPIERQESGPTESPAERDT